MDRVLFMLMAGGRAERLKPLTDYRPKSLIRFGPGGTLMDYSLYNILTSDAGNAVVLSEYLSDMVENYVKRCWKTAFDAHEKRIAVIHGRHSAKGRFEGSADSVYQTLQMIGNVPDTIVVSSADHLYRMDYRNLINFHRLHGGALTIGALTCEPADARRLGILNVKNDGRVTEYHEKPASLENIVPAGKKPLASMGIYVFQKDALLKQLEMNQKESSHDFGKDVIPNLLKTDEAHAFFFAKKDGSNEYWRDLGDMKAYWKCNMDILNGQFKNLMLNAIPGLYQTPFTVHNMVRRSLIGERKIYNAIIAETARIGNAVVEDSVIGPDVLIEDGAVVKKSVLLDGVIVRRHSVVEGKVVEPLVEIRPPRLKGDDNIEVKLDRPSVEQPIHHQLAHTAA